MYRTIQRKLSVVLIFILSLGLLWGEEAFARRGGGFGRGIGRSFSGRSFRRSAPRRTAPRRRSSRGIESSRSNRKRSGFTRSKSSAAALKKRGASPARIGKKAPSRAKSVRQFKTAQRRAAAKQTYKARAIKGKTVRTATPPSRIKRSHKQYGSRGLYRGTTRDTYRGTTIIHNYNYGGMGGFGGGIGSFWMGYMLANFSNALYFNWFYHNWDRMDRQALRAQMDEERYRELERRVAELERQGVPRDPENYNVEVPDRDVQAYLEQHPELEDQYYAATYELDQAQDIEEPSEEISSKREPSEGSGVNTVVYFLLGMGVVWLLLRRW